MREIAGTLTRSRRLLGTSSRSSGSNRSTTPLPTPWRRQRRRRRPPSEHCGSSAAPSPDTASLLLMLQGAPAGQRFEGKTNAAQDVALSRQYCVIGKHLPSEKIMGKNRLSAALPARATDRIAGPSRRSSAASGRTSQSTGRDQTLRDRPDRLSATEGLSR